MKYKKRVIDDLLDDYLPTFWLIEKIFLCYR